jgi:molecular chaperone DnaK
VERLVGEAEANKGADRTRRELVELRNKADGLVYSTERTLEEFAEHIDAKDRAAVEKALETTREAMGGEDLAALRGAIDELSGLTYQMTEKLYAALGSESEGSGS